MLSATAYLLDRLTLRTLCLAYFVLAPFFLNQADRLPVLWVFMAGHLFTGAILGLYVCRRLATFNLVFHPDRLTALVFGFVALALVSVLINSPANFLKPGKLVLWYFKLALPAFTLLVLVSVLRPRDVPLLFGLLCAVCAFSVLVVGLQASTGFPPTFQGRFTSFYFDPNGYVFLLNAVLAFTFPATLARLLHGSPFALLATVDLTLVGLIGLTGSRGGLLMAVLLLLLSVLATRAWKIILSLSAVAVPLLAVFALATLASRSATAATMSDLGRIWTYMVAWEIVKDSPFFGVGYGGVVDSFLEFGRQYYLVLGQALDVHNAFLGVLAETGIGGVLLFCLLLLGPVITLGRRVLRDSPRAYPVVALAGLNLSVSFVIYGMFYPHFLGHDDFWMYYALVVLILRSFSASPGVGEGNGLERSFPFSYQAGMAGGKAPLAEASE